MRITLIGLVVAVAAAVVPIQAEARTAAPTPTPSPSESPDEDTFVTLQASRNRITYGDRVRLFGEIDPASEGEPVNIVDEAGRVRGTATTNARGRYSLYLAPGANSVFRAQWLVAVSDDEPVNVRPKVRASLGRVRLFDDVRAKGRIAPNHSGDRVTVRLIRKRRVAEVRRVRLSRRSTFKTRFRIRKPGAYRVKATIDDDDHLPGADVSRRRRTRLPSLSVGSRGGYVKLLERRLWELGYYLEGRKDAKFDRRTYDAVIAFHKVQGRARSGSVGRSTWRALASPKTPKPRVAKPKFHIEVDQTKQVLYVVKNGRVARILHVSTGANGYTHDGNYRFFREINGYSGGGLYYPTYFDGLRAIHGWPEVPTYPASHGCVRVPMWAAKWIFGVVELGDEIKVYHS